MYKINISKEALFDLEKIDKKNGLKILEKINDYLKNNPFPRSKNPKRLQGVDAFRLRFGNYRVIYKVIENTVFIYAIGHRKDVYRMKRTKGTPPPLAGSR